MEKKVDANQAANDTGLNIDGISKRYYHELDQSEIDSLIHERKSSLYVLDTYLQPTWCNMHEALLNPFGCFSLLDLRKNGNRTKISREYCENCDCFIS